MSCNQVADDIPSNPLGASVRHTRGEAVADDRNPGEDTNVPGGQKPEGVAAVRRCQCW